MKRKSSPLDFSYRLHKEAKLVRHVSGELLLVCPFEGSLRHLSPMAGEWLLHLKPGIRARDALEVCEPRRSKNSKFVRAATKFLDQLVDSSILEKDS